MSLASMNENTGSGRFATTRRGGLTAPEIREIEAHRAKERPTPWSALAKRYGRCETDLRAAFAQPEPEPEQDARSGVWSPEDVTLLRLLFIDKGKTVGEIVKIIDRDESSIKSKLRNMGLARRGSRAFCRHGHAIPPERSICGECEKARKVAARAKRRAA